MNAAEGQLLPVDCLESVGGRSRADVCAARDMWTELSNVISAYLKGISNAQLAADRLKKYGKAGKKR